ncbi:hypothetical protein N0V83_002228 [Neocucurbitaria cava]|uniref:Uncharacterized protein n=1 Tax=Neocucurbitaria cava TaxID=798079 RepID=A0A9W9CQR1_9PLEO|nr:hypothetical protein N0V83_002228 [Neocucurbitaria cava]
MRELEPNLNASHPDFENKAAAFFKYANYDEQMCQSLEKCEDAVKNDDANPSLDHDVRYVAQYLEREYYVS